MGKPRGGGGADRVTPWVKYLRVVSAGSPGLCSSPGPERLPSAEGKGGVKQLAGLGLAAERRARTYIYTHTHIYNIHDQRFFPWGPGKSRDLSQALRRAGGRERRSLGGGTLAVRLGAASASAAEWATWAQLGSFCPFEARGSGLRVGLGLGFGQGERWGGAFGAPS